MAIFKCEGYFYFHIPQRETNVQSVTMCKKRQKKNSEADSFMNMKIKISYTHEDGHVGQNM
jgi:hypothetical protein